MGRWPVAPQLLRHLLINVGIARAHVPQDAREPLLVAHLGRLFAAECRVGLMWNLTFTSCHELMTLGIARAQVPQNARELLLVAHLGRLLAAGYGWGEGVTIEIKFNGLPPV